MPEYLAPGVYVEEVSSGNKPIQAASTSTAGVVGLTARGPVNKPTLITSQGQFNRVFGGKLNHSVFSNNLDALPYAVEGFFKNGGARVYVTRIVGSNAARASADVYSQDKAGAETFTTMAGIAATATTCVLDNDPNGTLQAGVQLLFSENSKTDLVTIASVTKNGVILNRGLASGLAVADELTPQAVTQESQIVAGDVGDHVAGGGLTGVGNWNLANDEVLYFKDTQDVSNSEYITITDAANEVFSQNGGTFIYDHPAATTEVYKVSLVAGAALTVGIAAAQGSVDVLLSNNAAGTEQLVQTADGEFYLVTGFSNELTISAGSAFVNAYSAGTVATVVGATAFTAHGIYQGAWGNDLRVLTQSKNGLTTTTSQAAVATDTDISLSSVFGVEAGTYLQFSLADGSSISHKVTAVDRNNLKVTLSTEIGQAVAADADVVSLEFDLIVQRLEGDTVVESERFDNLALDAAHSRYAPTVVGSYNTTTATISNSGESELIRLSGFVSGSLPLAGTYIDLADGDDHLAAFANGTTADQLFIGTASDDPDDRTGIQAMMNENNISIVAVPGQTSVTLQKALIAHCEQMRYRFAVLDAPKSAKLDVVKKHRQNYDTTFAAYYYPWLTIADPFGVKGDELNIAPSGHMLGVYARTDIQRGVHKAPANEVVKSILNFETRLTKGEQDILNPIHINCFRDFRDANRGLRIYGARTLSSDPEWRYVNVRRLFLFLEQSVDNSMQWAVFEPNAEPLWATVKRSLVNFLTTVWRSGALEGLTQDEAFYVNVGLDTMSQTDIDNGRLIVEIGVAPVKPAEFVIFRFSQKTREAQG